MDGLVNRMGRSSNSSRAPIGSTPPQDVPQAAPSALGFLLTVALRRESGQLTRNLPNALRDRTIRARHHKGDAVVDGVGYDLAIVRNAHRNGIAQCLLDIGDLDSIASGH